MAHEVFKHEDGRICERDGTIVPPQWMFDNGEDKDRVPCSRYHNDPADGKMLGHSMEYEGVHPRGGPDGPITAVKDRGEFGMPGLGRKTRQLLGQGNFVAQTNQQNFPHSTQAGRCGNIFDEAQTLFRAKNRGYGSTAYNLGARGQYADMNRKMGKLKHQLWDGNPGGEGEESMEEMLMDLMGHAALTIDFLRSEYPPIAPTMFDPMSEGMENGMDR